MDVRQRSAGGAAAVLLIGVAGLGTWVSLAPRTELSSHLSTGWAAAAALVPALATVTLLAWRLPRHGVTRVLVTMVLAHVVVLAARVTAEHGSGSSSADAALGRVSATAWALTLPLLPVLLLLFPTGRSGVGWPRHVLRLQLAAVAVLVLLALAAPEGDPEGAVAVLAVACGAVLFASAVAAAVRQMVVWRRLPDDDRARNRLFVVLAGVLVVGYVLAPVTALLPLPNLVAQDLSYAFLVGGLPTAIGVSVLRHRLFGLEVVLHRTLLGLGAGTLLLSTYLLVAYGVAAAGGPGVGQPASSLLPALLVVAVLAPVTAAARRLVDRVLYGERSSPQRALHRLSESLAAAPGPEAVPQCVARSLLEMLRVPFARVDLEDEGVARTAATAGVRGNGLLVNTPLVRSGERLGVLVVETRPGQTRLATTDRELLDAVATQAAIGLEAVLLTENLLRSRERLVLGREHERARLRRDLHDGLTPALAGMVLAVEAGRRVLRSDPAAADALLTRVGAEARTCREVVRRLLDDLRPPGLAELGLVASVEELAAKLHRPGEFEVDVDVHEPLPPVSEAVEVAAYRVAGEALANAARHARARRCVLRLSGVEELVVEVQDDGCGLQPTASTRGTGLGLSSMRERAQDVGGSLELTSAGPGTTVRARLPALPAQRRG